MNINQYAPERVYDGINSTIEDLKSKSNDLHEIVKSLDLKCTNYQFITEEEIDNTIDSIRNYFLTKESCLEQSKQILDIDGVESIEDLSLRVREHQNNSISITNEILHYAYEFLKIKSSNVITDGLLQDHREKLNSIISATLNEFSNMEETSKTLEPYKIALLYITGQISDLTQYAEMIYNTFGAILFYNIISGNNIEYDSNNSTISIPNIVVEKSMENTDIIKELEPVAIASNISSDISNEEFVENVLNNNSAKEKKETESLENVNGEEDTTTAEYEESIEAEEEFEQEEYLEDIEQSKTSIDFEPVKLDIEIEETDIPITVDGKALSEYINTTQIEPLEDSNTKTEVDESAKVVSKPKEEEYIVEDTYLDNVDYFESLADSIIDKYSEVDVLLPIKQPNVTDNQVVANFCNHILLKQFACASLALKEYSKLFPEMENLYKQYGVAIGDPCVDCNYSVAFISTVDEQLHQWLELSALLREMFTCKNKDVECYNFSSYVNSLTQNDQSNVLEYIPNFSRILEMFNDIGYNTNYIIGIKLFDEKNSINANIKQQASEMLTYCEKTIGLWNNHKTLMSASRNLFSSNGGIIYNLIKEIYIGDPKAMDDVKQYCKEFSNDNDQMLKGMYLESKLESYLHEQLSIVPSKRNNCDTDVNVGYKNKFFNRFTNILSFLFSYIEKMNDFSVNCINETNVEKYRALKNDLIEAFNIEHNNLCKIASNKDISKVDRAGMVCLAKTFKDIISLMDYETYTQNYYYCELLKTGYFLLDNMYIPYMNNGISNITGFEISTRVSRHLNDIKYISSWKEALENNIKKCNVGNVKLICQYLKDTNQTIDGLNDYLAQAESINYSIEDRANAFENTIKELYLNEVIPNENVYNSILDMENYIKGIVCDNHNYGFFDTFLNALIEYSTRISEDYYSVRNSLVDYIGNATGYDSECYTKITSNIDNHKYSIADEFLAMHFNNVEYSRVEVSTSQIEKYDEIFAEFRAFCDEYVSELFSPNGYIFMNEFYNKFLKSIVSERFKSSYDGIKSNELIDHWVKGQGNTNSIYDILINIGFGIDDHTDISKRETIIKLSNSEKKNSSPYAIPERVLFLNEIYNFDQAERAVSKLQYNEDTLVILDYALSIEERNRILDIINSISNGNRIVIADRCVITFLTTINGNIRKIAFKVCSLSNVSSGLLCSSTFRIDIINDFLQGKFYDFIFGREYFGKTYILKSVSENLKSNDNIVLLLDAYENTLESTELLAQACEDLELKINSFDDWATFESSMTRYLNKHPNKSVALLVDNAEEYLECCLNSENSTSLEVLKNLSNKFKDRFNFTIVANICHKYVSYVESLELSYKILQPLSYSETASMFEEHLNSCRISVTDDEVMELLVSKAFGSPEMVRLISKQISLTLSSSKNSLKDSYMCSLTLDLVNRALCNKEFYNIVLPVFLNTIIGSKERYSTVIPVVYAILYYLYEHSNVSTFTIEDIKSVLSIFDLEDDSTLNVQAVLEELKTTGLIISFDGSQYFLAHESYKNYLGSKEFAFDMLDECTRIFIKEGVTQ